MAMLMLVEVAIGDRKLQTAECSSSSSSMQLA
jgi:hypothetical protein